MPALAELIGQRAAQLNLGGSWDSSQTLCLPGSQERGDGNSRRPTPPDPCAWIPLQPSVAEHFPLFFEKILAADGNVDDGLWVPCPNATIPKSRI